MEDCGSLSLRFAERELDHIFYYFDHDVKLRLDYVWSCAALQLQFSCSNQYTPGHAVPNMP